MAYIDTDALIEYYEGADGLPDLRLETMVNQAGRIREWLAPVPVVLVESSTVTAEQALASVDAKAEYDLRAFDAELMLAEYIVRTQGGLVSGVSGPIGSESFVGDEQVRRIVRQAMATFYTGGGKAKSVPVTSSFPRGYPYRGDRPWVGNAW